LTDVARNDYAANSGSIKVSTTPGPTTLAAAQSFGWPPMDRSNGIVHIRSEIGGERITDGLSHTYFVGEKYLSANSYEIPDGIGEAQSMYIGFDPDTCRWGQIDLPPLQDRAGFSSSVHFGSAHASGCYFSYCDGSVQFIPYTIDPLLHSRLANRADGEPVDLSQL
jgi:hypothetical protein